MPCGHIVVVQGLTSSSLVVDYPRVVTSCRRERPNERVMLSRIDGEYHGSRCVATKQRSYE
jgi:hypothetical protein